MNYPGVLLCFSLYLLSPADGAAQTLSARLKAESPSALANAAQEKGNAVRGAVLFPQQKFACVNCHASGAKNLLGPDLTRLGDKTTDESLVVSLLFPSRVIRQGFESVTVVTRAGKTFTGRVVQENKDAITLRDTSPRRLLITLKRSEVDELIINKKSAMPDNLMDQLEDRQQFLDLVKYLMTLRDSGSEPSQLTPLAGGGKLTPQHQGLLILDQYLCTNCHQNDLVKTAIPPGRHRI